MHPSGNTYTLSHHWLLGVPGIGEVIYSVQLVLLQGLYWHHVWVSRRRSKGKSKVIAYLQKHASCIMCTSIKLSDELSFLSGKEIVFSADVDEKPTAMSQERLRNLLWTLVRSTSITKVAKNRLSSFIPQSFPEHDK